MRFATTLFGTLLLVGTLSNVARAQPGIPAGQGQTASRDSYYTGPYSVYGPGLTYRQLDYTGPYSGRLGSPTSFAPTRAILDPAVRPAVRPPATDGEVAVRRPRYVRLSIAGTTVQAIVGP